MKTDRETQYNLCFYLGECFEELKSIIGYKSPLKDDLNARRTNIPLRIVDLAFVLLRC